MRKFPMRAVVCMVAGVPMLLAACAKRGTGAESPGIIVTQPAAAVPPVSNAQPFVRTTGELDRQQQDESVNCSLDAISWRPAPGAVVLDHHANVEFQGWAADNALGVPEKITFLLIGSGGTFAVAGATGQQRTDVAAARKNPAFVKSGYAVDADLNDVPQGEYLAALLELFPAGARYCELGKTVAIK